MGHTEIVPETVASTLKSSDAKDVQKIAQCVRYIKLLSCALSIIAALCLANIGILSWHIVQSVSCKDTAVTRHELKAEVEKAKIESCTNPQTTKILKSHEQMIRSLQLEKQEPNQRCETQDSRSTFTRWGRPDCSGNGTELVYSGYVGGGSANHAGSAVNYLCLTNKPTWNHTTTIHNYAYLYGTEYKFGPSYSNKYFGQNRHDQKPPCAVCSSTRASVIMIPGTNVCTDGWTREYAGYLVAGRTGHTAASEYICLDNSATNAEGSSAKNDNGKLMYLVEAVCGSLNCPPYVNDREVTCVVCTR